VKGPKGADGLDFEALRLRIERCDPDPMLGFYADDAELIIVDADSPRTPPFELHGRSEVAKHLRAVYGQRASHRVERASVAEGRVTFREACEYPDGSRVLVETTLEVRDGKIVRQVDAVARAVGADAPAPERLPGSKIIDDLP
jgi:SnoaL-like protein